MGIKYDTGEAVFEPVVDELAALHPALGNEALERITAKLLGGLLELGWGNADASLHRYEDQDAVVAAFRRHGILLDCGSGRPDDGESCKEERGHTGAHRDYLGRSWADEEEAK